MLNIIILIKIEIIFGISIFNSLRVRAIHKEFIRFHKLYKSIGILVRFNTTINISIPKHIYE